MGETIEKLKGLTEILGKEHVITEPGITAEYAVDDAAPNAVVFPKNTDQVAEVVKFSHRENLAIVARGDVLQSVSILIVGAGRIVCQVVAVGHVRTGEAVNVASLDIVAIGAVQTADSDHLFLLFHTYLFSATKIISGDSDRNSDRSKSPKRATTLNPHRSSKCSISNLKKYRNANEETCLSIRPSGCVMW